jgi:hypothetical protein
MLFFHKYKLVTMLLPSLIRYISQSETSAGRALNLHCIRCRLPTGLTSSYGHAADCHHSRR